MTAVAPGGVWLGHLRPGTPEWDAARAGFTVTATEIAAVMGLSPWASRFSLWHKKVGLPTPPFTPSPEMEWGNRLEEPVAQKWADEHPGWWPAPAGTWQHRDRTWQRATPDRLLFTTAPDPDWDGAIDIDTAPAALLEVKTSPFGDGWEDGVPVHYQCQIQWQLDTLGLTVCHVALLVGGYDYREYVVEYDEADAKLLVAEAETFLAAVESGERPPIDGSDATYQTIRRQPEGRDDVEVQIPAALADRYEAACATKKAAAAEQQQAAAEVLDLIGTGRWAALGPRRIAQRTVRDGRTHSLIPSKQKASNTA
ncbi:YqaJ viral recombinase family nuclease [Streptomyces xiamenensis]